MPGEPMDRTATMRDDRATSRDRKGRTGVVGVIDVARRAGVSTATVSRVLNGVGQVRALTRERVEKVARDLDYSPNTFARALASQRSMTIGVIVSSLRGSIFASGLEAIQRHAATLDYSVLMACSDYSPEQELDLARSLAGRLIFQTLQLARSRFERYLADAVARIANLVKQDNEWARPLVSAAARVRVAGPPDPELTGEVLRLLRITGLHADHALTLAERLYADDGLYVGDH